MAQILRNQKVILVCKPSNTAVKEENDTSYVLDIQDSNANDDISSQMMENGQIIENGQIMVNMAMEHDEITEDEDVRQERYSVMWSIPASERLINLYKSLKPKVSEGKIRKMKRMWEIISEEMKKAGFNFTALQTENKWKSLERSYKKYLENKSRKPSGRWSQFSFEKDMREIFSSRCYREIAFDNDPLDDRVEEDVPRKKVRCSPPRSTSSDFELLEAAIERRSADKRKNDERNFEQRERLIQAVKERNNLLQQILDRGNGTAPLRNNEMKVNVEGEGFKSILNAINNRTDARRRQNEQSYQQKDRLLQAENGKNNLIQQILNTLPT